MNILEHDIKIAKSLIEYYPYSNLFDHLYPFCNENIKELFSYFNLKDKKCLSVLGSADQALDMFLLGAKSVDTFDVNSLTKYYFALKKAALLAGLTKEEYKEYFCYENYDGIYNNNKAFCKETYNCIREYLDADSLIFWDYLYDKYDGISIRKPISLFNYDELSSLVLDKTLSYLDGDNYYKLQNIAEELNINFTMCNINALYAQLSTSYDFMYFSNIIQYADLIFKDNHKENLIKYKKTLDYIKEYLRDDGKMVAGYIYLGDNSTNNNVSVFNKSLKEELFGDYQKLYIKSMYNIGQQVLKNDSLITQDLCLIHQKKPY